MFGLFSKKKDDSEHKLRSEFDDMVRQIKSAERERQALGRVDKRL